MIKNFWNIILIGLCIGDVLLQTFILIYVYRKNGGTTGGYPFALALPFAVSLIVGLYILFTKQKTSSQNLNLAVVIINSFGFLLSYWLERTGILVQYERWLHNEQIIDTENLGLRLLGFAGLEVLTIIGIVVGKYQWFNIKGKLK